MDARPCPVLVEADQLNTLLDHRDLVLVDMSPSAAYEAGHIPGAAHLDYDRIVASDGPVSGLLPEESTFRSTLAGLGIGPDSRVVAYDDSAGLTAARLLWTLSVCGIENWSLLNGGRQAWQRAGYELEPGTVDPDPAPAFARYQGRDVADCATIRKQLENDDTVLLDVRSPAEFSGEDRRSARGGHIPGAVNYEWTRALEPRTGCFRAAAAIRAELADLGVTPDRQVITYCQSHRRSSFSYVLLRALGFENVAGYPGAWSDWGNRADTPVEAG